MTLSTTDKTMRTRQRLLLTVILCVGLLSRVGSTVATAEDAVFKKSSPENLADLKTIETATRNVAVTGVKVTVCVTIGATEGSGVIIDEDGHVLTAGHLSRQPGRDVKIRLPEGRTARGQTLGAHRLADIGLVKILGRFAGWRDRAARAAKPLS